MADSACGGASRSFDLDSGPPRPTLPGLGETVNSNSCGAVIFCVNDRFLATFIFTESTPSESNGIQVGSEYLNDAPGRHSVHGRRWNASITEFHSREEFPQYEVRKQVDQRIRCFTKRASLRSTKWRQRYRDLTSGDCAPYPSSRKLPDTQRFEPR